MCSSILETEIFIKVLVLLGENYFARVSVEHALNIAKRRIAFIRKRLSDMNCENLQPEKSETRKQENESLADRWNNSMQLLEQYLQSSQVVNLCEEYDDSLSSEPIRIHGLKEDMLNKEIVEDVDWNSLLDVSGETAELVEPRHQLPDSVWDDLKQLEIAEASSLMGDLVVDSTEDMTKSGEFPVTGERNNVKESIQDAAAVGDSSKTINSSSTNLQRNVPRKTFRGQIKERKSVSK